MNARFFVFTYDIYERLMSIAGHELCDNRDRVLSVHFEQQMVFKMNATYWSLTDVTIILYSE